ncbi:hypothetical protein HYQ00_gp22 [Arthrobacter phage TripleJ]|uniref:Uncharacterized protein n=1 Tax=Arthrobacter phage TripleJ TaxID=2599838 RepID=A0A5J6TFU4_9CAUD|nr:hypothetical protein HYQ00_gp22 [Arthrobacter phage TripleJ]QFG09566.1 hypothetical protein PBI_TRIPLEJ_22 [Arthrobacter phage TripleJ]
MRRAWWKPKPPPPSQVEALHARELATRQLESANERHAEAITLAETLRQIRQRNHFGQSLENLNWSKQ